jgi:hypothetical protein
MSQPSRPTVIAENQTVSDVFLADIGATVPGSGTFALHDYYYLHEIQGSLDLYTAIDNDELLINDGVTTLTKAQSLLFVTGVASAQDLQDGVVGPASSTTNAIAKYGDTTGKSIVSTGITIDGSNVLSMGGNRISNLGTPTASTDAVTKAYADSLMSGVSWQAPVIQFGLNTPPGLPTAGDRYVVGTSPTGAWSANAEDIAEWNGTSWDFTTPLDGWALVAQDTDQQWIYNGTTWVSFGSTLDHGSLQGLGDDDHTQYLLVNGTRAMTGSLNMGTNNITNVGTVDGVDVSAHASRHLPGGADALTTAAASGLSATTTNTEGTAASFARSDHTHAIDVLSGSITTIQAGVATSSGTAAGLARRDHTHAISTGGATVAVRPDNTASEGTSTALAREDHSHTLPTAAPIATGTTNSIGSANTVAKSDHVHRTLVAAQDDGAAIGSRPTFNFTGAGVVVTDDGVNDRINVAIANAGDVVGPASSTDNAVARYDGTTGKLIQNSAVIIDDNGHITNSEGRFNGVRYYNASATDPSSPTPADGDRYYNTALSMWMTYDGGRSKWLSDETFLFEIGRNGNTAAGAFYRTVDSRVMSATSGQHALYNGTVVGFGYTRGDSDSATFEIVSNGTNVATLASTATSGRSTTLNGDFSQGGVLAVRNAAGGNDTTNVVAWVRLKWRV